MYLDSVPSHHLFHQCPRYSRHPRIRRTSSHSFCFVLCLERDLFHSKSPSDSSVFIVGPMLRSEDCQSEQQSAQQTMIINDPTTNYCRSVEDICIPMITRFDRLMFLCLRFGRRYHAIERRIRTPVDHYVHV